MNLAYSVFVGAIIIVLLLLVTQLSTIFLKVRSWVTWCAEIKYLRSLPSPPKHWLWGHALEVSFYCACNSAAL